MGTGASTRNRYTVNGDVAGVQEETGGGEIKVFTTIALKNNTDNYDR